MRILVCISNVPDTTTKVKFSTDNTSFDDGGVQWIINPWDELALTRAMELKEDASNGVSNVSVVSVGTAAAEPTLRKALAMVPMMPSVWMGIPTMLFLWHRSWQL